MNIIDLRSDTVTRPSKGMKKAIYDAEVGDDVYGDDPTVNYLEKKISEMLGKDEAVFMTSGTQSNFSSVLAHCNRGDEIIVGESYHICGDEAGGVSVLGGVAMNTISVETDGSVSNKRDPSAKLGLYACISSRITTVIHVVNDHQINYNCFNEPFAVSPYRSLY